MSAPSGSRELKQLMVATGGYIARLPSQDGLYVYLLVTEPEGSVVYVGQTTNVWRRVGQHVDDGKSFDCVYVLKCKTRAHMNHLEREFIRAYQPELNKVMYEFR